MFKFFFRLQSKFLFIIIINYYLKKWQQMAKEVWHKTNRQKVNEEKDYMVRLYKEI